VARVASQGELLGPVSDPPPGLGLRQPRGGSGLTRSYAFLIGFLAAIWGASYLFIKVAIEDFSPAAMMEIRLAVAAVVLAAVLVARTGIRSAVEDVRGAGWHGLGIGVVNGAIPFTLIAWGEKYIDSGVAAIANATLPIFAAMLAPLMLPAERVTGIRLFGFALGLVGVTVLAGGQPDPSWWFVAGTLAVVGSSVSYAVSSFWAQRRLGTASNHALATVSMTGGALMLLPLALLSLPDAAPSAKSVASLAALTLLGTALAQLILYRAIRHHGASRTSLVTYLMPPTALFYGWLLLDEHITAATALGLALILGGVAIGSGALRFSRRAEPVTET
jgi:drug/metabolite transporter (DMT)-like permease